MEVNMALLSEGDMIVIDCLMGHATRAEAAGAFPRLARPHTVGVAQRETRVEMMSVPMCRFACPVGRFSHLPPAGSQVAWVRRVERCEN